MTVGELIEGLQKLDPKLTVYASFDELYEVGIPYADDDGAAAKWAVIPLHRQSMYDV